MTVQELERTAARVHDDPRAPAEVVLRVNGREHRLRLDLRASLLDALREDLASPAPRRAATTASAGPARSWSTAGACSPA